MQEAAQRLFQKISFETPRDLKKINGQLVANVSVTVDGTWQKRGHSSKIGVVFVISVDKGEILDYSVKSLVCYECKACNVMNKESNEYKTWKDAQFAKEIIMVHQRRWKQLLPLRYSAGVLNKGISSTLHLWEMETVAALGE